MVVWAGPVLGMFAGALISFWNQKSNIDYDRIRRDVTAELTVLHYEQLKNATEAEQVRLTKEFAQKERFLSQQLKDMATESQRVKLEYEAFIKEADTELKNRKAKIDFVNGLKVNVTRSNRLLLAGLTGAGKSTFAYLLGLKGAEKPMQSTDHGTLKMVKLPGVLDTIGLSGWNRESLLKLFVVLLWEGIPEDLVVVVMGDRVSAPVAQLKAVGIEHPLIVMTESTFWDKVCYQADPSQCDDEEEISLVPDVKGVRRIHPEKKLKACYKLNMYPVVEALGLGKCITHHDDLEAIVKARENLKPFDGLVKELTKRGNVFNVSMDKSENGELLETLFRLVFLFKNHPLYKDDYLKFMELATVSHIHDL